MKTSNYIILCLAIISSIIVIMCLPKNTDTPKENNTEYLSECAINYEAPHQQYYIERFNNPADYIKMSYTDYVNLSKMAIDTDSDYVYDKIVKILSDIFDAQIEVIYLIKDPIEQNQYMKLINDEVNLLHNVVNKSEEKMIKSLKNVGINYKR